MEPYKIQTIRINDFLKHIHRKKNNIFATFIFGIIFGLILSFTLPPVFKTNTKLLPPQQNNSPSSLVMSQLGGLANVSGLGFGIKNPSDLYIGILKSQTISSQIIKKLDLVKYYDVQNIEEAQKKLNSITNIFSGKDGIIVIEIEDKDPKQAAKIANLYTEELVLLMSKLAITEASQRRLFFEKQFEETKHKLSESELAIASSIEKNGINSAEIQSKTYLETISRLRAAISLREIKLNSMRTFVTPQNSEFKRLNSELINMKKELNDLESGAPQSQLIDGKKNISTETIQLLRDVKYYQALYELIGKQFEIARLDEAKDNSMIQVLDVAIPPEKRDRPKRILLTLGSGIGFLILFLIYTIYQFSISLQKKDQFSV